MSKELYTAVLCSIIEQTKIRWRKLIAFPFYFVSQKFLRASHTAENQASVRLTHAVHFKEKF